MFIVCFFDLSNVLNSSSLIAVRSHLLSEKAEWIYFEIHKTLRIDCKYTIVWVTRSKNFFNVKVKVNGCPPQVAGMLKFGREEPQPRFTSRLSYPYIHSTHHRAILILKVTSEENPSSDTPYSPVSLVSVICSISSLPARDTPGRISWTTTHSSPHPPLHLRIVKTKPAIRPLSLPDLELGHEQPRSSTRCWWAATIARSNCSTSEGPACQESCTCLRSYKGKMDFCYRQLLVYRQQQRSRQPAIQRGNVRLDAAH